MTLVSPRIARESNSRKESRVTHTGAHLCIGYPIIRLPRARSDVVLCVSCDEGEGEEKRETGEDRRSSGASREEPPACARAHARRRSNHREEIALSFRDAFDAAVRCELTIARVFRVPYHTTPRHAMPRYSTPYRRRRSIRSYSETLSSPLPPSLPLFSFSLSRSLSYMIKCY